MNPERWQRIEQLYHAALERTADERAAFLEQASADDDGLRSEVEGLLAANEHAREFMATPALEQEAKELAAENHGANATVQAGQELSHYRILSRIGAGGMGEVFLARDTILERRVALKLLPAHFTQDADRLQRFVREAKAASALNHPNIITIYEIGQVSLDRGQTHFIATEFIEGETLRNWTIKPEERLNQTLNIGIQIASALDAAHKAGIVHRDIKPDNVMLRPDGLVKVLDFGLAKLSPPPNIGDTQAQTVVEGVQTRPGIILGTLRYMSPEQTRGRSVDARSDVFSLGVVLYEMLTGLALFPGESDADVIAAIIRMEVPPLAQQVSEVAPEIERILQKTLNKDAAQRYQTAGDLLIDLRNLQKRLEFETDPSRKVLSLAGGLDGRRPSWMNLSAIAKRPRVVVPAVLGTLALALIAFFVSPWPRLPYRPSGDALYWYDLGTSALRDGTYYKASKALEDAIEWDDKFALAHARLAEAWGELDYSDKAKSEILRARSLAGDLSSHPPLEALYLDAITHTALREFAAAIEIYTKIVEQGPATEKAHAILDLGRAYENNDQTEKAIESYQQASQLAQQDPAAFLRLGIVYGRLQNLEQAKEAFQRAEVLYDRHSNSEGLAEVFYQRGFLLKNLNKLGEARTQLATALAMARTRATGNHYQEIRALQVLSSVAAVEGNAREAEQQASEAIKLAKDHGIENQATHGLIWLGNSFLYRGEYADAERCYKQALELAQKDNGRLNEAVATLSLASVRSLQRKTDEALAYINQALPYFKKGNYRKFLALALTLLARVQRDRGEYDAALQALNEQLELSEEVGDRSQEALSHQEIGSVLVAREQYPEALKHFDKSCEIKRDLKAVISLGYAVMYRGDALWQMGRYQEAREALGEATSIAERSGSAYKQLVAEIHTTEARLELSARDLAKSKSDSKKALALAGTNYNYTAAQAKHTLGLAESRSGAARAGRLLCAEAVDIAIGTGDPQLIAGALLASAETMVEEGNGKRALELATRAQESFARFGQQESEWRSWLIAAQAKRRLNEPAAASAYASKADAQLSNLEKKWGPEAYSGYLRRPDIQHFRKQLGQLLK